MVPFLLQDFNVKGDKSDAKRLSLLDTLGYNDILTLAEHALDEGTPDMRQTAVPILGKNSDNEPLLMSLTNDRSNGIKEAALLGLIRMDSAEGKERMCKILSTDSFSPAIKAAAECTDAEYNLKIFNIVKTRYDDFSAMDKTGDIKLVGKKITALAKMLPALSGKYDDYVINFLINILRDKNPPYELVVSKSQVLATMPPALAVDIFERVLHGSSVNMEELLLQTYFKKAEAVYSREKIFDVFSPFVKPTFLSKEVRLHITMPTSHVLDPRWAKIFIGLKKIYALAHMLNTEAKDIALTYIKEHCRKDKNIHYPYMQNLVRQYLTDEELDELDELAGYINKEGK